MKIMMFSSSSRLFLLCLILNVACHSTSTNKEDKPIGKNAIGNSVLDKIENGNSTIKNERGENIVVICFLGKDVFVNNENVDKDKLKDKLKYLINDKLKEGIKEIAVKIFYEAIKFADYEPLAQQIKHICKAYLDKEAREKYNKEYEKLSNSEKMTIPLKFFISESEKRLMDEYNIPNYLKCSS